MSKKLSDEQTRRLVALAQSGCVKSRNTLVEANLPYLRQQARAAARRCKSLDEDDLLSEAVMGWMHGIQKFDLDAGTKLLTYCAQWVRAALGKAIANQDEIVRVPSNRQVQLAKVQRASAVHTARTGTEATDYDLAKATRMSPTRIARARSVVRARPVSLDQPISGDPDGETHLSQLANPDDVADAGEQLDTARRQARGAAILRRLAPRERHVLTQRFEGATLQEIGQELGYTRESIRLHQLKALAHAARIAGAE